jgi:hypothetical protein
MAQFTTTTPAGHEMAGWAASQREAEIYDQAWQAGFQAAKEAILAAVAGAIDAAAQVQD